MTEQEVVTHGLPPASQVQPEPPPGLPHPITLLPGLIELDSDSDQRGEASDDCVKSPLASRRKTSLTAVAG